MEDLGYTMSGFLEAVTKVGKFSLRWDDDFFDRCSHRYTVIILVVFVVVTSTKQYVGDPISCWCPATFTDPMIEYTNHICWISNTYFVPMQIVPDKHDVPREEIVGYYQWIPLVLLLQTLCFYTPSIIWSTHNNAVGMDINRMVLLISGVEHINPDIRDKSIKFICRHFDRALAYQREYRRGRVRRFMHTLSRYCCCPIGKLYGNYLIMLNLLVKLLYILNAVGQLWLLNVFISNDTYSYTFYGLEVLTAIWHHEQPNSRMFPRITLCDFQIRQMQNVHDYTVQCTLPINLFNEKIYIFLWFWILFVAGVTVVGFVYMIWTLFSMNRVTYLKKYLRITGKLKKDNPTDERLIRQFVNEYLRQDGVFALRLVAKNTNDVITAEQEMTTTAGQMVNTTVNGTAGNVTTTAAYVDPFFGNLPKPAVVFLLVCAGFAVLAVLVILYLYEVACFKITHGRTCIDVKRLKEQSNARKRIDRGTSVVEPKVGPGQARVFLGWETAAKKEDPTIVIEQDEYCLCHKTSSVYSEIPLEVLNAKRKSMVVKDILLTQLMREQTRNGSPNGSEKEAKEEKNIEVVLVKTQHSLNESANNESMRENSSVGIKEVQEDKDIQIFTGNKQPNLNGCDQKEIMREYNRRSMKDTQDDRDIRLFMGNTHPKLNRRDRKEIMSEYNQRRSMKEAHEDRDSQVFTGNTHPCLNRCDTEEIIREYNRRKSMKETQEDRNSQILIGKTQPCPGRCSRKELARDVQILLGEAQISLDRNGRKENIREGNKTKAELERDVQILLGEAQPSLNQNATKKSISENSRRGSMKETQEEKEERDIQILLGGTIPSEDSLTGYLTANFNGDKSIDGQQEYDITDNDENIYDEIDDTYQKHLEEKQNVQKEKSGNSMLQCPNRVYGD